jgi:hypothetical protein
MMQQFDVGWECPECHLKRGEDRIDPCFGHLPGVKYACCGHGGKGEIATETTGYIYFNNGIVVRFPFATQVYDASERRKRRVG